MSDNVRVGRESLTKKISYHDKSTRPYKTIESLDKEPTKKKILLNDYRLKKESHPTLTNSSQIVRQERKMKSLGNYDLGKVNKATKKRSDLSGELQLSTIDGLLNRNIQMIKFSVARERDRLITKQKYKRSEQVRSLLQNKKMSSITKLEHKDNGSRRKLINIYQSTDEDSNNNNSKPPKPHPHLFKDLNLESIINPHSQREDDITLQDCFELGCAQYYHFLSSRQQRLSNCEGNTILLKEIKEELNVLLETAMAKFNTVLQEVGELSIKNLMMIALVSYQQTRHSETIMYLVKVLERTDDNLFLLQLPGPTASQHQTNNFLSKSEESEDRKLQLPLLAYLYLAESYKLTNNYLCAINTLRKCENQMQSQLEHQKPSIDMKLHYQTLQSRDLEEDKAEMKQQMRMKKKSYLLSALQPESTANKFKKYSHTHNLTSMELNKSKPNLEASERNKAQKSHHQASIGHSKGALQKEEQRQGYLKDYSKELVPIFLLLARLYTKIKSYDLAIDNYRRCLQINFRSIEPLLQLASLYYLKYSSKKSLQWLEQCLAKLQKQQPKDKKLQLDISYINYHKSLILLQEKKWDDSYALFCTLTIKELASEVNYYKGLIKLKKMQETNTLIPEQENRQIQSILIHFTQAISAFTSKEYLVKSYFNIILILVFKKKDYYGAQYEVTRFKKLIPTQIEPTPKQQPHIEFSRISKIYEEDGTQKESGNIELKQWTKQSYINILFDIIDGVIYILKMKIGKGISIFKQISLKIESYSDEIYRHYGHYYKQIIVLLYQFKFYAYYILREYELSLKHVNKLIEIMQDQTQQQETSQISPAHLAQLKFVNINRLMLECMILMRQNKFNYAMSKLTEIENLFNQSSNQSSDSSNPISSTFILNNFNLVKSLCYINLYAQLEQEKLQPSQKEVQADSFEDNNKEILLSAEELLRHCLITDKQNSLIYYLISAIHYELEEYESSLKYIRQALQFSDDHMIKHYFCKANSKTMLGRYQEAIKDYTNAIIVYKQQVKNDTKQNNEGNKQTKGLREISQQNEDYYQEKQEMFNEIYLNRGISYIKHAYELSHQHKKYSDNCNLISNYRTKAGEDLSKYFRNILDTKQPINHKQLKQRIMLLMHTDQPNLILEISKQFQNEGKLIDDYDAIKVYYLIKELNNCITHLQSYILHTDKAILEKNQPKTNALPPKHKKMSTILPKKNTETHLQTEHMNKLKFDLKCLEALKKSSSKSEGALEQSLISLLEITEQIYRKRQKQLHSLSESNQNYTLESLFSSNCGEIFHWSDILFFIGVIHFELKQYETAIKYLEESYNEKKTSSTLYSLDQYFAPILNKPPQEEEEQEYLFYELEPLFENRIYCKEQLEYNIGICYLLMKKYKQAYYYLQNYPNFLYLIKQKISAETYTHENQFINASQSSHKGQIRLEDESQILQPNFHLKMASKSSSLKNSISAISQKKSEASSQFQNITPFPTHNRLCSIYSPNIIEDKQFYLSFCLPKIDLPLLGLFSKDEIQYGQNCNNQPDVLNTPHSQSSANKSTTSEKPPQFKMQKRSFESIIKHITLIDLEMKPIAPWIRQNTSGVIFTENLINQSIELNSERHEKKKDKMDNPKEEETGKKNKKQRYDVSNESNK